MIRSLRSLLAFVFSLSLLVLVSGCDGEGQITGLTPALPAPAGTSIPPLPISTAVGEIPSSWTVTGSTTLYARLYQSSTASLDTPLLQSEDLAVMSGGIVADRIVTAVAADLLVQYHKVGTLPLEERGNDLVVWRTNNLIPIPTEKFDLASDDDEIPYDWNEVKLFVRDVALLASDEMIATPAGLELCSRYRPWWRGPDAPERLPEGETYFITPDECFALVRGVHEAIDRERTLHMLRQDLMLSAYGEEFLWDGQLGVSPTELRSYDLLLDLAGVGNILGGGSYEALFESGNQGEQCDSGNCACVYGPVLLCGDGILQGGLEQCDDGNRYAGDGCDEFCQVEHNYCGDGTKQYWEECSERRECPDGRECGKFSDCIIGGGACFLSSLELCQNLVWEKTCRVTGQSCGIASPNNPDADCTNIPDYLQGAPSAAINSWRRNSCRYAAGGVCWIGQPGNGIIEGSSCKDQEDCSGVSSCTNEGFCTNHPYRTCSSDEQCYSCSAEEITGTCYEDGSSCNGNEDCPLSGYCMLEPDTICRSRTVGGMGNERSNCNGFCEQNTRCGDGITYLTENGSPEECDDGMHCADGSQCFLGQICDDQSICTARDGAGNNLQSFGMISCTAECKLQICGDGTTVDQAPEECDDGAQCEDGTPCSLRSPSDCAGLGNGVCRSRGNDGCSESCRVEKCGDKIIQTSLAETCDDGNEVSGDGCSSLCAIEKCSDGIVDADGIDNMQGTADDETCDDGNGTSTDACYRCRAAICGDGVVWEGHEACDYGTGANGVGLGFACTVHCTIPLPPNPQNCNDDICGNGCKSLTEECDDGNALSGDGCSDVCTMEYCGDGSTDTDGSDNVVGTADDEACDDGGTCFAGASNSPIACKTGDVRNMACAKIAFVCSNGGGACFSNADCPGGTCTPQSPSCVPKDCGDGCDNRCRLTGFAGCGNGVRQCEEECDDGNTTDGDGCNAACLMEFCGDGVVDADGRDSLPGTLDDEECDAEWLNSSTEPDACRIDCKNFRCGDGVVDSTEECDVPTCETGELCKTNADCAKGICAARGGFGCSLTCRNEGCGDGTVQDQYGEECDDGNVLAGDGCTGACRRETTLCGNEVVDPEGTDSRPGTADDEECDYSASTAGVCPDDAGGNGLMECDAYGDDNKLGTSDDAVCNLGTCNRMTQRCSKGNSFICLSDEDCTAKCVPSCTPYCKVRAMPCGDGYRDPGEQCDDGNEVNGDGCSAPSCHLERPDFCGNGRIDPGEQCDQMHPYLTIECTPFCQFPHDAPQCGDGRKDPSGERRGDLLSEVLMFSEGYRLDGRWPAGRSTVPNWTAGKEKYQSGGGWYVTPRVFDASFVQVPLVGVQTLGAATNGAQTCSLCGNGILDTGEVCDSGRLSNGSYPTKRYNVPAWERFQWSIGYATNTLPNFWRWYQGIFPFSYVSFDSLLQQWQMLGSSAHVAMLRGDYGYDYYGHWNDPRWWLADIKEAEERPFITDACSATCELARCGNDRIDPGESCDDDNQASLNLPPQNGDGCSSTCALEAGFDFAAGTIKWPAGAEQPVCGDDLITIGEQCDNGGACRRRDGITTAQYCRREPGRTFCDLNGIDNIFPSPDDEIECVPVPNDGCDASCHIEPLAICGNGKTEPYEECDAGTKNGTQGSLCTTSCLRVPSPPNTDTPYCGDGTLDQGEECDDSNGTPLDGCTYCLMDLCGNSLLDAGEQCDDGNRIAGDGCGIWCIKENFCGNGEVDDATNEQCDDGNDFNDDGCSALCRFEYCGDGIAQFGLGEECDAGAENSMNPSALCRADCTLPRCGDGIADAVTIDSFLYKESCDPGKHCARVPTRECTDDIDCSLGPCDAASGTCAGDSSLHCTENKDCGFDSCIVQDRIDPSSKKVICTAECTAPVLCGDGRVQGEEECDHEGAGCIQCMLVRPDLCGNGVIDSAAGEKCDDRNRARHDGCSATCQFEDSMCPGDCFLPFECTGYGTQTGEVCDPADKSACPGGACTMRADCAKRCTFGLCGNGDVDPGEQCDDGRQCTHDRSIACSTQTECATGSCEGADPATSTSGSCNGDPARACMTNADCFSLCITTSGDGCSVDCRYEITPIFNHTKNTASLIVCQEERSRIGSDQIDEWQETLLDPSRNPFIGYRNGGWWSWYWDWYGGDTASRFPWKIWTWYNGFSFAANCGEHPEWCYNRFPNSLGNGVQLVVGSLGSVAQHRTMPDRFPLMPFEPVGVVSYPACQEPRAALVTAVEIPSLPTISIPPYRPSALVRTVESYLCAANGFPRRNFPFLCDPGNSVFTSIFGFSFGALSVQQSSQSSFREMILGNTLAIGYRAGESIMNTYIEEAVQTLSLSLESAVQLFTDLERINFATEECPLDDSTLCQ